MSPTVRLPVEKLVCELCGSNAFTKDDDGMFACDYCRTKYTAAEAKKMMVEGVVSLDRSSEADAAVRLGRLLSQRSWGFEVAVHAKRALELEPENAAAWQLQGMNTFHWAGTLPESDFALARQFAPPAELAEFEAEQQSVFDAFNKNLREIAEENAEKEERAERGRSRRAFLVFTAVAAFITGVTVLGSGNTLGWVAIGVGVGCLFVAALVG